MSVEINKFLAKAMDECYHEFDRDHRRSGCIWACIHCGDEYMTQGRASANKNKNYFTWSGFGKLWEWVQKQEFYGDFMWKCDPFRVKIQALSGPSGHEWSINPEKFANTLYQYLKDKNEF